MVWGLEEALVDQRTKSHLRQLVPFKGRSRQSLDRGGRHYLNFSSNDYLGLSCAPEMQAALQRGVAQAGVGSGAAHLVTGHHEYHQALEETLADWLGRDEALLFSTGYIANLAVISTFLSKGDCVFEDKWNHASLIDGARLSQAQRFRYRHVDIAHLEMRLQQSTLKLGAEACSKRRASSMPRALLVTDAVFSMDGDIAPLPEMVDLAQGYPSLRLFVDDAHGLGVLGEQGRGSLDVLGLSQADVPLLVGTLGKALGTAGAFVAGPKAWIDTLRQFARPYIYTTATPPALAYATLTAIKMAREDDRRRRLQANLNYFKAAAKALGLPLVPSDTPIQPLILGEAQAALKCSQVLQEEGFWVGAIRPPTVAEGTSRLRVTLTSEHQSEHIDQLIEALHKHLLKYHRGLYNKAKMDL
jgi:8-amino-7-oxononanoate synthase